MNKFLNEEELKNILESEKAPALNTDIEVQNMSLLAENQAKYVSEEVVSASGDVAGFTNVLVPAMRRIMPALFSKELVAVQPMTGPTGYVYAQRFFYKGSKETPVTSAARIVNFSAFVEGDTELAEGATLSNGAEVKYVEFNADGESGSAIVEGGTIIVESVTIGSTTLDIDAIYSAQSAFKQILKNYSGPYTTEAGESLGTTMRQVGFKIDRVTVTAQTRKLKSEFTLELVQDLQSQHGQNAEAELLNLIEFELQADIDQEILALVKGNAVAMTDVSVDSVAGNTEASKFQGIYTQIINACEQIVHDTKRGAGNIVVASPKVIAALSLTGKLDNSATKLNNNVATGAGVGVAFVGTLDNGARVFRDAFADSEQVLVAYKGATAADAGAFYAPYIPLMVQKATNPETLQPIVAMMTRYGLIENPLTDEVENGANPYFRSFGVDFSSTTLA